MTGGTAVQPGQQAEVAEGASLHSCDVEGSVSYRIWQNYHLKVCAVNEA